MAPQKRRHAHEEVSSDSEDDSTSAKRTRRSASEDDEQRAEDDAYEVATQSISRKMEEAGGENVPADGGIIEEVTLENFMCHSFYHMPFGPLMNFVIGHNGSGKSAILTGITLALGGKAAATNRGSSMKKFIKEGQDTARITVKIKNMKDGFKTEQYGDSIIIERTFTRDGSSGYKLKSKAGRTISSKRDELDEICDFYGFQVENPLTVLTQDLARAFLATSTNAQKYAFFAKGVQLEQLDQDYGIIDNGVKNTEPILESRKDDVRRLKELAERAKQKVTQAESHEEMRSKYQHVQHQMAWVQVREAEDELNDCIEKLNTAESKVLRGEQEKEQAANAFEEASKALEIAGERVKEQEAELGPIEDQKKELKETWDNNKRELSEKQTEERSIHSSLKAAMEEIDNIKKSIEEEESRLENRNGEGSGKLTSELNAKEVEAEQWRNHIVSLDTEQSQFSQREDVLQGAVRAAKDRLANKKRQLESAKDQLDNLHQAERDKLHAYGKPMSNLLQAISRERGFRQKPVGPLGLHVTLLEQKWMDVLENFFGRVLGAFVVTNHEDYEIMQRLMREARYFPGPTVYITQQRDFEIDEPNRQFNTILRILKIDNEVVKRQLIVNNCIEQVILIEDLEEATTVMRRSLANVQQCYALNRNRPGWGHRVGSGSVAPVLPWKNAPRMKSDSRARIQAVEADIERLNTEVQDLDKKVEDAAGELSQFVEMKTSHSRKKRELQVKVQKCEERVDYLKGKIDEIAADGQLSVLQESLKTQNERRALFESQYEEFVRSRDALNNAQNHVSVQKKALDQDYSLAKKKVEDAKREQSSAQAKRDQALLNKNHWFDKVAKYEAEAEIARHLRNEKENDFKEIEEGARAYCAPVEVPAGETGTSIDARLIKMKQALDRAEKELGGTHDDIVKAYIAAQNEFDKAQREVEALDILLKVATKAFIERRHRWKLFQRYISARARAQFTYMMSERAFKGRLRLEHKERPPELIIEVQPGGEETGNRGPKTLSGGEKSFSTICLLLSLWEAMGSPFRCLDEFDVFMDSVNRSISVNMMIKAAQRSISKQFILITPQAMDGITSTFECRIHRMDDPDRTGNQSRLNFG